MRRQDQEHCASITCMIRHYVARRAQVTEGHPHNAASRVMRPGSPRQSSSCGSRPATLSATRSPCSSPGFGTATSGWAPLRSLPPAWWRCRRAGPVGGPPGRFGAGCIHKGAVGWLRCGDRGMTLDLYSADSPSAVVEAAMATKITVALEDDLDGGPASGTVRFGLGAAQYEIDLNKKNARTFRKKLTPYVEHARKGGPGQRRGPARTASSRQRSGDIRAWAKATGLAVSDRGRIPASVVDQYEATTTRPLRTPGCHRHEPIRSDGRWLRPASQRRAGRPFRLPPMAA